jgi:hypothetical protein
MEIRARRSNARKRFSVRFNVELDGGHSEGIVDVYIRCQQYNGHNRGILNPCN